jgi:26S proteasome regulatory subunit T1
VIQSVAHVQSELPRRLAARVNAIQALPYIVGTNPYIARMLEAYRKSFLWLVNQPKVQTLEGNAEFTEHLATLVEGEALLASLYGTLVIDDPSAGHANDIPTIAKG